jgi:NADH-quinone oxidoreductase subunit L
MTDFFIRNIWIVILLPLAGTVFLHFFGRRIGEPIAGWIASTMVSLAFIVGLIAAIPALQGSAEPHIVRVFEWLAPLGANAELLWDPLSTFMVLIVTGVGAVIHVYSIGYMHGDERFSRYFTYLNLFITSMLILVLANNFGVLFVGWEMVGLCSYLLISFYFVKPSAAAAGKKAFIVNRIGDFGFLIGLMIIFSTFGTLSYTTVLNDPGKALTAGGATLVGLLLLIGATGKSAQLPLYVWLPDAMEGPSPVSALIHAATMVTAGVFMIARTSAIYGLSPVASGVVATIGAVTAFYAATIAMAQTDAKRVLAYSTISQIGYMILGVGSAAYVAGVFHLMTHAFFKALLFLGAGAVMHVMSGNLDIFKMGGLWSKMKITGISMVAATLAISGIPPFAGFWSKDDILGKTFERGGYYVFLWAIGLAAVGLTAFYMTRWFVLIFLGKPRWDEGVHPHAAPKVMAIPLLVLAFLATFGGLINTPFIPGLEHFLEPTFEHTAHAPAGGLAWLLSGISVLFALGGMGIAWRLYRRPDATEERWTANIPAMWRRMGHAYYMDDVYGALVVAPGKLLAAFSAFVLDKKIVDGFVNGVGIVVRRVGAALRPLQSGYVRNYALTIAAGVIGLVIWFLSTGGL